MDHLTVTEAAELKGCSIQNIQKLCKDGKLPCTIEINDRKRPKYMIPVSSLPEELQARYYSRLRQEAGLPPVVEKALKPPKKLSEKSFEDFSEEERGQIVLWRKIVEEWQHCREQYPGKRTEADKLFIAKCRLEHPELQLSEGVLYRKWTAYKLNDLAGLLGKRGGANKGASSIDPIVWDQFVFIYLSPTQPKIGRCYELTVEVMKEYYPELVDGIPTVRTFSRHIETDMLKAVKEYLLKGTKAMRDNCLPYFNRLYDRLEVNEVWIADNHTFDIISIDEDTGQAHRLHLTSFMDAKSGVIVGWNVTDNPCSQSTLIAFRHGVMRFGGPKVLYFDNGREFLTHDIAGKGHRKRGSAEPGFQPMTILERMGIEMRNAMPRNAKAKPIERSYSTLTMQFSRAFTDSYCGGTIMQKPEGLTRRIKEGKIACDYEIREKIAEWIDYDYNVQPYGGYESRFKGMSRIEVWNKEIQRTGQRVFDESDLNLMLLRTTRVQKIKRNGVFLNIAGEKIWFMDYENTFRYLDKEVYVRYDPADLRAVRIYDTEDRYLFTWGCADKLLVDFNSKVREEVSEPMAIQRRVEKFIKAEARSVLDGVSGAFKVDLLEAAAIKAAHGKEKFKISSPNNIILVRPDENEFPQQLQAAANGYENSDAIEIYLDNINNDERKE